MISSVSRGYGFSSPRQAASTRSGLGNWAQTAAKNLCKTSLLAVAKIASQNGHDANKNPVRRTPCRKGSAHKRHLSRARVVG